VAYIERKRLLEQSLKAAPETFVYVEHTMEMRCSSKAAGWE
jgi:hypothetical protein